MYWNTRLNTEHVRLVSKFNPGEAVCDVMAGVGPFALPAAKKKVWVWANDLNPESYSSLVENMERNKVHTQALSTKRLLMYAQVTDFVNPFCADGHSFIRTSTAGLLKSSKKVTLRPKIARSARTGRSSALVERSEPEVLIEPKIFSHYVLNLPATATTFLPSFIGLYAGHEDLFSPHTSTPLPMIHVYCFSTKSDGNKAEEMKICREISGQLGYEIAKAGDEEMEIWDVRDVAPEKRIFCASFRLPAEVAFRELGAAQLDE